MTIIRGQWSINSPVRGRPAARAGAFCKRSGTGRPASTAPWLFDALKQLFDLGVRVTINSDDPEVLETNLNNEYRIAHEILGMSLEGIKTCNRYAVEASFLPEAEKQAVLPYFSAGPAP